PPTQPAGPVAPPRPSAIAESAESPRAAIEIVCFGGPRILVHGRQVWPGGANGDAKPWELFLYLATQPACGVSRDILAAAMWPDTGDPEAEADATHRLRQLRYRLRGCLERASPALGRDAIQSGPGGILRIEPTIATSDAQRFLECVRSGRVAAGLEAIPLYEEARALYVGDLLGSSEAKRYTWLDERGDAGVTLRESF